MNKKGIATKKHIKEKAYLLFAEKGFKQVTMKDICEITGLSRGDYTAIIRVQEKFSKKLQMI